MNAGFYVGAGLVPAHLGSPASVFIQLHRVELAQKGIVVAVRSVTVRGLGVCQLEFGITPSSRLGEASIGKHRDRHLKCVHRLPDTRRSQDKTVNFKRLNFVKNFPCYLKLSGNLVILPRSKTIRCDYCAGIQH